MNPFRILHWLIAPAITQAWNNGYSTGWTDAHDHMADSLHETPEEQPN